MYLIEWVTWFLHLPSVIDWFKNLLLIDGLLLHVWLVLNHSLRKKSINATQLFKTTQGRHYYLIIALKGLVFKNAKK